MRGAEPRILLFSVFHDSLDIIVVEPVAVFLSCASMWIRRYISRILCLGTHMELTVVALPVEVFWRNVIVLDGVFDV